MTKSVAHVEVAFDLLLKRLQEPHSQVRLLTFRLLHYLAQHSKRARLLFEEHVSELITLSVGSASLPLPRPYSFATVLRQVAVDALNALARAHPALFRLQRFVTHLNDKVPESRSPCPRRSQPRA